MGSGVVESTAPWATIQSRKPAGALRTDAKPGRPLQFAGHRSRLSWRRLTSRRTGATLVAAVKPE